MNAYQELKKKHQEEFNNFPLGFAFGDKQFEELMEKWGLDVKKESDLAKVVHVYSGAYVLEKDVSAFKEMLERTNKETEDAIKADKTGDGFIYDMFYYELNNHEYGYTGDYSDTLDSLGYTIEEIQANSRLKHGLEKAAAQIMKEEE